MKILTRYILREFCVPLFYCLTGFVSIYLLFELFGSFSRLMAAKPGLSATAGRRISRGISRRTSSGWRRRA